MAEPTREALPEPLKVVAWLTSWPKDRIHPTGSIVNRREPQQKFDCNQYSPLVRLADALSALESERQAHATEVERWIEEDREIMAAVVRELGEGNDGNAPGHAHSRPGIWDWDNGERAGKPCSWCLCWGKFTKLVAIDQAIAKEKP